MIFSPIIPVPVMAVICAVLILLKRRGIINFIRQIIIVILVFMINMRPMIPGEPVPVINENIDILIVVDNTISMVARDYDGHKKRLDGVKDAVSAIVDEFPDARMALITFNNRSEYQIPYTYQSNLITDAVELLNGQIMTVATGTTLNIVYDTMEDVLTRKGGYDDEEEERMQLVFFFSDGEITADDELDSFEDLYDYIDGGIVFGIGTEDGQNMYARENSYFDNEEVLQYLSSNYDYITAKSKIDEDNLEQLADDMGLDYWYLEEKEDAIEAIEDVRDNVDSGYYATETIERNYELYWILAIALAVILFTDFIGVRIKTGKER